MGIGLDDLDEEHVHRWADGTLMDYENNQFNRYPNGRPDKVYFSEDCVEEVKSRAGFYWNDENCAKVNAFVCQLDAQVDDCQAEHSDRAKKVKQKMNRMKKSKKTQQDMPNISLKIG